MCSVYLQYAWLFVYIAAAFAVVVGAGLPLRLHLKPSFDPSLAMLQLGVRYREFRRPWKLDSADGRAVGPVTTGDAAPRRGRLRGWRRSVLLVDAVLVCHGVKRFAICFLTYNGALEKDAGGDFGALHPFLYLPQCNETGEPMRPKGGCS